MTHSNLAQRLAHYAVKLRFEDIPAEAVHEAKRRLIDSLATAVGAMPAEAFAITQNALGDLVVSGTGKDTGSFAHWLTLVQRSGQSAFTLIDDYQKATGYASQPEALLTLPSGRVLSAGAGLEAGKSNPTIRLVGP